MFDAMERGELKAVYVIGENPIQSEADQHRAARLIGHLDFLVVQDLFMTDTAAIADVVFPAAAGRVRIGRHGDLERAPGAAQPPHARSAGRGARGSRHHLRPGAGAWDTTGDRPTPSGVWNELRSLSPVHAGMSYARLEAHRGLRWPCYDETHPGEVFLHSRLWERPVKGPRAPFHAVAHQEPADALTAEFPLRLTTGRRLAEYNTGVQTGAYASPTRRGETLDLSPEDAASYGLDAHDLVRIVSRRGAVVAPVHIDPSLRPGLAFMTFHFPEEVQTNQLTIDAQDPKAGHRRIQGHRYSTGKDRPRSARPLALTISRNGTSLHRAAALRRLGPALLRYRTAQFG